MTHVHRGMAVSVLLLWVAALAGFLWLILGPLGKYFEPLELRLILFAVVTALGATGWRICTPALGWPIAIATAALLGGAIFQLLAAENTSLLRNVSSDPFSLGWSEASRYYYASLWLAKPLYGVDAPPSVLHATRYLMQAAPFLIPRSPIWLHRLWQIFLFVSSSWLTTYLLLRRLRARPRRVSQTSKALLIPWLTADFWLHNPGYGALLTIWAALFLLQAPVYYHLLVVPMVVLLFFNAQHFWRSMVIVGFASIWAGLSRINWLPVPGLLAAAMYLLETPLHQGRKQSVIRYLFPPAAWVTLGTALGYLAQLVYKILSGNPPEYFGSSFSSELLWYRLHHSMTDPIGVLPRALIYVFPLGLALLFYFVPRWRCYHFLRWSGLLAILAVLFAGGLLVSIKIGGGKGLHNLDAFWVLLLVVVGYMLMGKFTPDVEAELFIKTRNLVPFGKYLWCMIIGVGMVLPLGFALASGDAIPTRNASDTQKALATLRDRLTPTAEAGGEILFISQRQLLTFDNLPGIKLIPEYETVFLMEMAMGKNQFYLQRFRQYLRDQRFSLIVAEPQYTTLQGWPYPFGEENDAWVNEVSIPLLCSYMPEVVLPEVNLTIFAPNPNTNCPEPSD